MIKFIYILERGVLMFALQGYYDGNSVQTLDKIVVKKSIGKIKAGRGFSTCFCL